jgi:hypothetical protein
MAALLMAAAAVALPASASGQKGKEEEGGISGRYVDGAAGFQIDFPDGWRGSRAFSYPLVSPESFSGWPSVTMSVMTVDTQSAKVLWQDPNFKKSALDACKELARNYVTINKMRVSEVIKVCENDSFARTKTYSFATRDNIIIVTFNANSTASYDRHITEFEKSVSSIKIAKPADLRTLVRDLSGQHSSVYKVTVPGTGGGKQQTVDVKVDSTSTVKNLQMKDRRTVSFDVEGRNGTRGVTEISIGALMKSPYEVRVDGAVTKEVKKTEDRTTGETLLSINYSHGSKHKVTVTSIKRY